MEFSGLRATGGGRTRVPSFGPSDCARLCKGRARTTVRYLSPFKYVLIDVCMFGTRTSTRDQLTAVRVAPPCCVTRGRQRTFIAPLVKASSDALLDHTNASPGPRFAMRSAESDASAALAF